MFGYARLLWWSDLLSAFVGKSGVFLGKSYIGKNTAKTLMPAKIKAPFCPTCYIEMIPKCNRQKQVIYHQCPQCGTLILFTHSGHWPKRKPCPRSLRVGLPSLISRTNFYGLSGFSIVVVAENRLYTTTTSRLHWRLLFGVSVSFRLQTGCERRHEQQRNNG